MKDLRLWANYYYNMGFNVTHIIPHLNEGKAKNPYKSATNDRHILKNRRQSIEEMQNYLWEISTGIGVVLGFNNLRAIDFDFKIFEERNNFKTFALDEIDKFITKVLNLLGLPEKYEWVVKTPSGGFHILFYAESHGFKVEENKTKALLPNTKYYKGYFHNGANFSHIELRWDKHLVLPPSINDAGLNYIFKNDKIPSSHPLDVNLNGLLKLLNEICYDKNDTESGYNLFISHYRNEYKNDASWSWWGYGEGEYLDFFPIYFHHKDMISEIPKDWLK